MTSSLMHIQWDGSTSLLLARCQHCNNSQCSATAVCVIQQTCVSVRAGFSWWQAWGPAGASLGAHKTRGSRPWGRGPAP